MNLRLLSFAISSLVIAASAVAQPGVTPVITPSRPLTEIKPNLQLARPIRLPDLTVMSMEPRMLSGVPYLYVCVKNTGTATGPFDVEAMMQQGTPSGSPPISWAVLIGKIRYPSAPANGGFVCNDFRIPGNQLPNCVKYSARADSSNEIAESNEANNGGEKVGTCLGTPPLPASSPKLGDISRPQLPRIPTPPRPPEPLTQQ